MLNVRRTYIEKANSLSNSGVHSINIDVDEPISGITFIIKATNGATSNTGQKLVDAISNLEIVNGSDVLYSLEGAEAVAHQYHTQMLKPIVIENENAAGVQELYITILFGRYLGDPDFYLNPADFRNLQAKIQTALTISATVGFATGTATASTIAHLISHGAASSSGFRMTKSLEDFTLAASGDKQIIMPTDYDYLNLMVMARETQVAVSAAITNFKLSVNQDRIIPFDLTGVDVEEMEKLYKQPFRFDLTSLLANDGTIKLPVHLDGVIHPKQMGEDIFWSPQALTAELLTFSTIDATTAGTPTAHSATAMLFSGEGYCPYGTVGFKFAKMDNVGLFPISAKDNITLKLTQGNAGGVGRVVLDQLRTR